MALQDHSIRTSQSQQTLFTQQLVRNVSLLSCNIDQLRKVVLKEIENNPALEIIEELDHESLEKIEYDKYTGYDASKHSEFIESLLTYPETLNEYLLKQFRLEVDDPIDIKIGTRIIENLDEEGFLKDDVFKLCMIDNVTKERVTSVQRYIQSLDPVGCATKDSKESVKVQLSFLDAPPEILKRMETYFSLMFDERFKKDDNAKATRQKRQREKEILENLHDESLRIYLHGISPYPGLLYNQYYSQNSKEDYIIPDAVVEMDEEEIKVKINNDIIPVIGISERIVKTSKEKDKDMRMFSTSLLHSAQSFIAGLQYRATAVKRVVLYIVQYQRAFLMSLQDSPQALTRKQVAKDLQINESTVSRIVSEKYIQTPKGIFPLRYFLSHGIGTSNISVQEVLKAIEDILQQYSYNKKPTDEELVALLAQKNIILARRTVAKYRKKVEEHKKEHE